MVDVWELAKYVEAHPENYEQRWRLAKRLYKEAEFRLALEHLFILKNEWESRLNVIRYLAATYYRLKRYGEAAHELEGALREWPRDEGLHEQLAHTLEAAGRPEDALDMWERLAKLNPRHATAQADAERVREAMLAGNDHEADPIAPPLPSDTFADYSRDVMCPQCGAQNGPELTRCWHCHGPLSGSAAAQQSAFAGPAALPNGNIPWLLITALAAGVLAAGGIGLTIWEGLRLFGGPAIEHAPYHFAHFMRHELFFTRIYAGLLFAVGWPLVTEFCLSLTPHDERKASPIASGLFLAALAYAATWLPGVWLGLAPILVLGMAGIVSLYGLGLPNALTKARVWGMQIATMIVLLLTLLAAVQGFRFVVDIPALAAFGVRSGHGGFVQRSVVTPADFALEWQESGSAWLDRNANAAELAVAFPSEDDKLYVEIARAESTFFATSVQGPSGKLTVPSFDPGQRYTLSLNEIRNAKNIDLTITIRGVLEPVLQPVDRASE